MRGEFSHSFLQDAGKRAAPAGVHGSDGAFSWINEKNRNTVGGLNAKEKAGSFGERGVAFAGLFGCRGEGPDDGRVDLLECDEREFFCTKGSLKFLAVGKDVFASVPVGEAEAENFAAVEFRSATGRGAETVDEPGNSGECFQLQNS